MADNLLKNLTEKAKEHSDLSLLVSQWNFDEKLIPKALQNIVNIFPHFSMHDVTHSQKILMNIERLLGDRVNELTATDTWLLLESAYWHDIGMVVSSDEAGEDLKSEEFKKHLSLIASTNGHELQYFAEKFKALDPKKDCFAGADTPQQAIDLYKQLLATWYRAKHASRSEVIVNQPWEMAGISSPRNELIPQRLFRILGQICRMHGEPFESVMGVLPQAEAGMATEACHPRFVACLLRLGDLFDLDDNRFCPVMLRMIGELPNSSKTHLKKHAALRHFNLNPDQLEIYAVCENEESYELTDHWFRMIETEIQCQSAKWRQIVPSRDFGLLPTIEQLAVNLAPPSEILDPGERPVFGVDDEKVIELLQGAGLYTSRWQAIRELLQNAVDATLIRIWIEKSSDNISKSSMFRALQKTELTNPIISKKLFEDYPIDIYLKKTIGNQTEDNGDGGKSIWRLEITDKGTGISKEDLRHMIRVGGSSRNLVKRQIIEEMPEWMRPSGAFGVGIQSAFLISDEIAYHTKSMISGEALKITMNSTRKQKKGYVYLQRLVADPGQRCGTTLSIEFAIDHANNLGHGHSHSFSSLVLDSYDSLLTPKAELEITKIADFILDYQRNSILPINLDFNGKIFADNCEQLEINLRHLPFYDSDNGIMIRELDFNEVVTATLIIGNDPLKLLYRGQAVSGNYPFPRYLTGVVDILSDSAERQLTLNRNSFKSTAIEEVREKVLNTIIKWLKLYSEFLSEEALPYASGFIKLYGNEDVPYLKDKWYGICFTGKDGKPEALRHILENDEFLVDYYYAEEGMINVRNYRVRSFDSTRLLALGAIENGYYITCLNTDSLYISKKQGDIFHRDSLRREFTGRYSGRGSGKRYYFPCYPEYSALSSDLSKAQGVGALIYLPYEFEDGYFILPFLPSSDGAKITTNGLESLIQWTYDNNNAKSATSMEEIGRLYNKFIDWVDNTLMVGVEEWSKARSLPDTKKPSAKATASKKNAEPPKKKRSPKKGA